MNLLGTALRIDLSAGSFYQDPFGTNGPSPQAFIGLIPTLAFDTYVGIIGDSTGFIAGGAGDLGGGPLSMDAPQMSVAWANNTKTDTGYHRNGMLTLSDDAVGTGQMYTRGTTLSFNINNGQIPDVFASLEADPVDPPTNVDPGPFPDLSGPPIEVPYGVTAQPVDSALVPAGYVANELVWVNSGPNDYISVGMRADLTSGDVYQHPFGFDGAPNPTLFASYPELEFDSYVGLMNSGRGGLRGGASEFNAPTFSLEEPIISAEWFDSVESGSSSARIGMLTLSEDANGVIAFRSAGVQWSTTVVNGVIIAPSAPGDPYIPEPATLSLLALAGPLVLRRR